MALDKVRSIAFSLFYILIGFFVAVPSHAIEVRIAVITDGPQYQLQDVEEIFLSELLALTRNEFDVSFERFVADWSLASVNTALQRAYDDPTIDMVLVLGFAANQLLVSKAQFAKPTFLPLVFNADLLDAPVTVAGSGRKNLNYLADKVPFSEDLASFQRVIRFRSAALLTDAVIIEAIPQGPDIVREQGVGIDFSFLGHDGQDHNLIAQLPAGVDAVLLGGLPRMPAERMDALLRELAERGLPVFSLVSDSEVARGALAADIVQTDYSRTARRNALSMQAVMLGERTQDQPVSYDGKRRLTINMETARKIGLSPTFDVMSEADLINARSTTFGAPLTLISVAEQALVHNLDLAVSEFDLRVGEQDVLGARANLLPRIDVGASYTVRRELALTRTPGFPQRSTAGVASLSQPLFVESARSGYRQQQLLQDSRTATLDSIRLDVVLDSTTAYLQALRAENQFKIQQENLALTKSNLELARDRVRAGSASNADVFRWEASVANARSAVLSALAAQQQSYDALSRILNRPIGSVPALVMPAPDDPFGISAGRFDQLINNPRRFAWFADYVVDEGLSKAPELAALDAQADAAKRDVLGKKRAFWAPDVSLQAQYTDSINAEGLGAGTAFDDVNDWNVSVNASWPLFDSGARRAQLSRASLLERQLKARYDAIALGIEQQIRGALLSAQASYANIALSERAAIASRRNLALVSDAYRQGSVSIIDLLDAQNQSLQADLSANNAIHDFLLNIMSLQRATGVFEFLLAPDEQAKSTKKLFDYIENREAQRLAPGVQP